MHPFLLDPSEWDYLNEGNEHVVLQNNNPSSVLYTKILKLKKIKPTFSSISILPPHHFCSSSLSPPINSQLPISSLSSSHFSTSPPPPSKISPPTPLSASTDSSPVYKGSSLIPSSSSFHPNSSLPLQTTLSTLDSTSKIDSFLSSYAQEKIYENLTILKKYLPEDIVFPPSSVPSSSLLLLSEKIHTYRPPKRLNKTIDLFSPIILSENLLLSPFSSSFSPHTSSVISSSSFNSSLSSSSFVIELKPKSPLVEEISFGTFSKVLAKICPNLLERAKPIFDGLQNELNVTKFRKMQLFKNKTGDTCSFSQYDPRDLFSLERERVKKAFQSLLRTPQNNLRFLNGMKMKDVEEDKDRQGREEKERKREEKNEKGEKEEGGKNKEEKMAEKRGKEEESHQKNKEERWKEKKEEEKKDERVGEKREERENGRSGREEENGNKGMEKNNWEKELVENLTELVLENGNIFKTIVDLQSLFENLSKEDLNFDYIHGNWKELLEKMMLFSSSHSCSSLFYQLQSTCFEQRKEKRENGKKKEDLNGDNDKKEDEAKEARKIDEKESDNKTNVEKVAEEGITQIIGKQEKFIDYILFYLVSLTWKDISIIIRWNGKDKDLKFIDTGLKSIKKFAEWIEGENDLDRLYVEEILKQNNLAN